MCMNKFVLTGMVMTASLFGASSVHEFTLNSIEGKPAPLSAYQGKVVLIVNVASRCGFTPQYAGLEKLYEKYLAQGFVILGFPANNFLGQGYLFGYEPFSVIYFTKRKILSGVWPETKMKHSRHSPLRPQRSWRA